MRKVFAFLIIGFFLSLNSYAMTLAAIKAAVDYQVSLGHAAESIELKCSNGVVVPALKLVKVLGTQDLIPDNPAPAPKFILEAEQL